jgi:hypothetical protein
MKKLLTLVTTMLLAGSLAFAQTGGGADKTTTAPKTESGKKAHKGGKKAHKGGKKTKKGSTDTTAAPK